MPMLKDFSDSKDRKAIEILTAKFAEELAGHYELTHKVVLTGCTKSSLGFAVRFETVDPATGKAPVDPYFLHQCSVNELDPTIIGYNGMKLTGYTSRRPKFPWDVEDSHGEKRKATTGWVKSRFSFPKPIIAPSGYDPKAREEEAPKPSGNVYESQF